MPDTTSKDSKKTISPKKLPSPIILSVCAMILVLVAIAFNIISWKSLSQAESNLRDLQIHIQTGVTSNQKNIEKLAREIYQITSQQLLAETAYLIHLAHTHLITDGDVSLAIELLKRAQESLEQHPLNTLASLKEALNQDISTLSTISPLNLPERSEELDQLKSKIAELSLSRKAPVLGTSAETKTKPEITTSIQKNKWENFKENWGGLKKLFIIRRINNPAPPLQEPKKILFLKENLQLKLTQAQWALLNQNASFYKNSLNTAIEWLSTYNFNQTADDIIKQLHALSAINIQPTIPSLKSLPVLNELLSERIAEDKNQ